MGTMSAKRAFLKGMARTTDLFGSEYKQFASMRKDKVIFNGNDRSAIAADWQMVGCDMRFAIDSMRRPKTHG